MCSAYEVALGPAAVRMIIRSPDPAELGRALSAELIDGPNAAAEVRYDGDAEVCSQPMRPSRAIYTATPLSYNGYTALHRPMTAAELTRLAREQGRPVAGTGCYVLDILPAESAFIRRPRPL